MERDECGSVENESVGNESVGNERVENGGDENKGVELLETVSIPLTINNSLRTRRWREQRRRTDIIVLLT